MEIVILCLLLIILSVGFCIKYTVEKKESGKLKSVAGELGFEILALIAISLLVRLAFVEWSSATSISLVGDEHGYFRRAVASAEIIRSIARLTAPSLDLFWEALSHHHLPLYSVMLGLPMSVFGTSPEVARITTVAISALTTGAVYVVGRSAANRQVGIAAALIHVSYPTFVAFSPLLWSETLFTFLVVAGVACLLNVPGSKLTRWRVLLAVAGGSLFGLAALTRASILFGLIVAPAWLYFVLRASQDRYRMLAAFLAACLVTVAPWQTALMKHVGHFVPLSTSGGLTLYHGNNPWQPEYPGERTIHMQAQFERTQAQRSQVTGDPKWKASQHLAIEHIRSEPVLFLKRSVFRLRHLLSFDRFSLRHFFHAVFPPMGTNTATTMVIVFLTTSALLWALITVGAISWSGNRGGLLLLFALAMSLILPSALISAYTRYAIPSMCILLPLAARGLVFSLQEGTLVSRAWAGVLAVVVFSAMAWNSVDVSRHLGLVNVPSTYYVPTVHRWDRWFGSQTRPFNDEVIFRVTDDSQKGLMKIGAPGNEFAFRESEGNTIEWDTLEEREFSIQAFSYAPVSELVVLLRRSDADQSVSIRPVSRQSWRQWMPTGLAGIEYMWAGGGLLIAPY